MIAILEDDPRRVEAMTRALAGLFPESSRIFFVDAPRMIEWLGNHQLEVDLFSLDHDLNDYLEEGGGRHPAGTGRDVAGFLALQAPTCPVIVHSSNDVAAVGMVELLKSAGWPTSRVFPYDDVSVDRGAVGR